MSLILKDRCKNKVISSAGTGPVTLSTAVTGFSTISSALSNGDTSYFCLESANGEWEVFVGTYTSSGATISRDTVLASSNSGSKINLGTSITFCYIVAPADKITFKNSAGEIIVPSVGLRFSDASVQTTAPSWGSIGGSIAAQTDLSTALGLKANLASPTFTGTPSGPTATVGSNTTQLATTSFVSSAIAAVDLSVYALLPDALPVAGTLLSYGGSRQLAAGGTVTHSGELGVGSASDTNDTGGVLTIRRWRHPSLILNANTAQGSFWGLSLQIAGTEKTSLKVDNSSGEVRWNVSSGGYYPTIYSNGVQRMVIDTSGNTTFAGAITASGLVSANVGITLPVTQKVTFTDSVGSPMSLQAVGAGAIRFGSQFSGYGEFRPGGNGSPFLVGSPSLILSTISAVGYIGIGFGVDAGFSGGYFTLRPAGGTAKFRNVDDSADAPISCGAITASGAAKFNNYSASKYWQFETGANGIFRYYSAAGPSYNFQIIGDSTGSGGSPRVMFTSGGSIEWGDNASSISVSTMDLILKRANAGVLAQRNGLNAQCFLLSKTYTSDASQEAFMWDAGKQISGKLGLYSYRGSSGGSNYPIQIGMLAADGTTFSGIGVTTAGSLFVGEDIGAGGSDSMLLSGTTLRHRQYGISTFTLTGNLSQSYLLFSPSVPTAYVGRGDLDSGNRSMLAFWTGGATFYANSVYSAVAPIVSLGGTTSAYPCLTHSGSTLKVRLADNSADAALTCGAITASAKSSFPLGFQVGSYGHFRSDGTYGMIQSFYNNGNGTATATSSFLPTVASGFSLGEVGYTGWTYLLLQSGSGTAILRPAATDTVEVRNSSNTGAGNLACGAITASGNVTITGTSTSPLIINTSSSSAAIYFDSSAAGNHYFGFKSLGATKWLIGNQYSDHSLLVYNANASSVVASLTQTGKLTISDAICETPTQSSVDPTTTDIPTGKRKGWYNSTLGEFRDWVNIGGVLFKSAVYT